MKVFQILNGFVYHDFTPEFSSAADAAGFFSDDIKIVDAPDNVFVGWGYDDTKSGDERFLKPVPQEGYLYDDKTGTFYPEGGYVSKPTDSERIAALESAMLSMMKRGAANV